ncbi:hypothetical protein bcere0016_4900 [Bacillus cereus 95/8201]|uniref:hypothetical protein n=1 Tax=Bacillus cereus group TaxID=86661 RepID=UPI0001A0960D|nr:hypothetical protein [Bacillus cereus]AJH62355.1 hypothetical protein BG11_3152 [Bacillus cereus]AJK35568.1 hypothetical protein BF33_3739 [Bacillus cereus]EEL18804.1 hypothetical protein bcere0016_4900 [Bacillus cereus 95/8201]KWU67780.1 hypothetical protein AWW71_06015 [Bacillus cereus]KWW52395.1 hypothetical protein AWW69_03805 [Bacillus cereus]
MMCKNDDKQDGLKCDGIFFDEMIQFEDATTMKIKEKMRQDRKEGGSFSNLITNGLGNDVQLVGGIDFGKRGADWTIRAANPRLLVKGEDRK